MRSTPILGIKISLAAAEVINTWANIVFVGSLVAGVVATYAIIATANIKEDHLKVGIADANARAGEANASAANANARAVEANARAVEANASAADANARAAEAELALVKFRAPRLPSVAEQATIAKKIAPHAPTKFDVGHDMVDREQWDFLWVLEPVISGAGWDHIDWVGGQVFKKGGWPGDRFYGVMGVINVSVEIHPQSRAGLLPAAEALAQALNEVGITASVGTFNNSSVNADAVHLLVGPKR